MHFKPITTQLYDLYKGDYWNESWKDPEWVWGLDERIRIQIFELSGFVLSANFLTELLPAFQKLFTHGISFVHTARRMYFAIARKNSSYLRQGEGEPCPCLTI